MEEEGDEMEEGRKGLERNGDKKKTKTKKTPPLLVYAYCIAGNFRQRKISSEATVRQFVRNLFLSNVGRLLFGRRSFAYSRIFLTPHLWVLWKNSVSN